MLYEVITLDHRLALLRFHQVDRLLADHAADRAFGAVNVDPLPRHQVGVDAADRGEVEISYNFV